MSEQSQNDFTAYEYKKVTVESNNASFYLDGYESFGWQQDENFPPKENSGKVVLYFKRSRKLVNRMELTRLQRNFEANLEEITALEQSKSSAATAWAVGIGMLGTAFMAAAVFAITAEPPRGLLCIVLAVPAFAGWIAPCFVYRTLREKRTRQVNPFIEEKNEEIYAICEKGQSLL